MKAVMLMFDSLNREMLEPYDMLHHRLPNNAHDQRSDVYKYCYFLKVPAWNHQKAPSVPSFCAAYYIFLSGVPF